MFEIAEARPAILLGNRDAVKAERAHFRPQLDREPVLLVDAGGERRDPVGGEAVRGLADRIRHFPQRKIQPDIDHDALLFGRGPSRAPAI
jgi:hypothetical protein